MDRRSRFRWLVRQPWWWVAQLQNLAGFALAMVPTLGLSHRIAAAIYGLASNVIATRAMFIESPRTPLEQMTERQRAKLFREHPEAREAWARKRARLVAELATGAREPAAPPPLPPAPDEKKGGA